MLWVRLLTISTVLAGLVWVSPQYPHGAAFFLSLYVLGWRADSWGKEQHIEALEKFIAASDEYEKILLHRIAILEAKLAGAYAEPAGTNIN